MFSPLTNILIKIFAKGFYRAHSGLLLFFIVTIITSGFFVEVLNQTHFTSGEVMRFNLLIVLTLINSPVVIILVFAGWFFYTIKSWNYVTSQLLISSNQFLFYSSSSSNRIDQFKSWFVIQFIILLPIIGYGIFSLLVGIIFGHYIAPIIILLFILLLNFVSAIIYVEYLNKQINLDSKPIFSQLISGWVKPLFSLFLYHAFDQLKVTLIVTKFLSFGIIASGLYLLANVNDNLQVASIMTLGIVTAHSILIYQSYRFEISHLSFARNFPFNRAKIYSSWTLTYLLLTLPEMIWLLTKFDIKIGVALLLFNISTGMLFRNLQYLIGLNMKRYLCWVFYLFNFFFIIILLKMIWVLLLVNLITSFLLFNRNYYKQDFS
jgi:hypothetical protein